MSPECETGQFGEGCKETCSDHCAGDKNPCHHINGTCDMGCDPGYHGLLCIKGKLAGWDGRGEITENYFLFLRIINYLF